MGENGNDGSTRAPHSIEVGGRHTNSWVQEPDVWHVLPQGLEARPPNFIGAPGLRCWQYFIHLEGQELRG